MVMWCQKSKISKFVSGDRKCFQVSEGVLITNLESKIQILFNSSFTAASYRKNNFFLKMLIHWSAPFPFVLYCCTKFMRKSTMSLWERVISQTFLLYIDKFLTISQEMCNTGNTWQTWNILYSLPPSPLKRSLEQETHEEGLYDYCNHFLS